MGTAGGGLVARMRKENNNSNDWLIDDYIRIEHMCPRCGLQMTPVALALEATNMYQWHSEMFVVWLFIAVSWGYLSPIQLQVGTPPRKSKYIKQSDFFDLTRHLSIVLSRAVRVLPASWALRFCCTVASLPWLCWKLLVPIYSDMRNHHGKPMFLTFLTFFDWGVSIGIVQLELSNENNAFRTQSCQLPQVNEVLSSHNLYIYI